MSQKNPPALLRTRKSVGITVLGMAILIIGIIFILTSLPIFSLSNYKTYKETIEEYIESFPILKEHKKEVVEASMRNIRVRVNK